MRRAGGVRGLGKAAMEALDGHADSADALFGAVQGFGGVSFFVAVKLDEFTFHLASHGFDGVFVFEHGFEFVLAAQDLAHGFGGFQAEATLLEGSVGGERRCLSGNRVEEFG